MIDSNKGTDAKVRVLIEWRAFEQNWATVGVSGNVIEASWKALVDAIRLELMRIADLGKGDLRSTNGTVDPRT